MENDNVIIAKASIELIDNNNDLREVWEAMKRNGMKIQKQKSPITKKVTMLLLLSKVENYIQQSWKK